MSQDVNLSFTCLWHLMSILTEFTITVWQILFTGAQVDKKTFCAGEKGVGMLVHLLGAQRLWNGFVPLRTSGCLQAALAWDSVEGSMKR